MKTERHFFHLSLSIVNTIVFAASLSLFLTGFIVNLASGIPLGSVASGILFSLSVAIGIAYAIFDGWANWRVSEDAIIVSKLFRGTKTIMVSQISSVDEGVMDMVSIGTAETMECYEIHGEDSVIKLPKCQASDALIAEIKKRNSI